MKRRDFAIIVLTVSLTFWFMIQPFFQKDLLYWFALPFLAVGIFGIYSLFAIFKSVFTLNDFPEQQQSLHYDISRAKQFYKEKGLII